MQMRNNVTFGIAHTSTQKAIFSLSISPYFFARARKPVCHADTDRQRDWAMMRDALDALRGR
jgi:hypothetical protein